MTSPHFGDFAPTPDPAGPQYGHDMTGDGRWFVLVDPDGRMAGTVWTDDDDSIGLLATEQCDKQAGRDFWAVVREAAAAGVPVAELFDLILAEYSTDTYGEGELQDLLAAM